MRLVLGFGVNDADYVVRPIVNGKGVICPFYRAWSNMLERCYSVKRQARQPTYIGCSVTAEWRSFMAFKRWMETQDWQGKHLDKDLLVSGNKKYAPETCAFVDMLTNSFTIDAGASRGEWPIGVHFHKPLGKFRAACSNPFTKKQVHLGYFECENQAHETWRKHKHQLALQLADLQTDERIANALRSKYE